MWFAFLEEESILLYPSPLCLSPSLSPITTLLPSWLVVESGQELSFRILTIVCSLYFIYCCASQPDSSGWALGGKYLVHICVTKIMRSNLVQPQNRPISIFPKVSQHHAGWNHAGLSVSFLIPPDQVLLITLWEEKCLSERTVLWERPLWLNNSKK